MDRAMLERRKRIIVLCETIRSIVDVVGMFYMMISIHAIVRRKRRNQLAKDPYTRETMRMITMHNMVYASDTTCVDNLRMDRDTFNKLCHMLHTHSMLKDTRNIQVQEMVAIFLYILAHHVKNRICVREFKHSGETISRSFKKVLRGVILLQQDLLNKPKAVFEDSDDSKWKWFKNCLGALDGTYISINVPQVDQPRYRTRKTGIATNVLGVCSHDMQINYVLSGWEGSAQDSRVLRDAISRPNGLVVPNGCYYLVDAGYPNGKGFLAPFRGQRYHLNDWNENYQPQTPKEFFNMKNSRARNVIERCFGLLKSRWAILRSPSWYSVRTHNRIVIACCLLHNLIRREMPSDPLEDELEEDEADPSFHEPVGERITYIDSCAEWTNFRANLALEMYNEWMATRGP